MVITISCRYHQYVILLTKTLTIKNRNKYFNKSEKKNNLLKRYTFSESNICEILFEKIGVAG